MGSVLYAKGVVARGRAGRGHAEPGEHRLLQRRAGQPAPPKGLEGRYPRPEFRAVVGNTRSRWSIWSPRAQRTRELPRSARRCRGGPRGRLVRPLETFWKLGSRP
jgi:hypothetical protein